MKQAAMELFRVVAGMFVVFGGWLALQVYLRKRSGCHNPDKDILDYLLHGCGGGGCGSKGGCSAQTDREKPMGIRGAL